MRDAVELRDRTMLLDLVSDDIEVDFGGGAGKREFVQNWKLDTPGSRLWSELGKALALGCAESGDAFVSPSSVVQFDGKRDVFETLLAVVPGSAVRAEPSEDGAVVASLNWDLLTIRDVPAPDAWQGVKLDDGKIGFVRRDQVRSIVDMRAVFERREGRWLMTAFVGGD